MWAQRFNGRPDQNVLAFVATNPEELAEKINKQIEKFHVRIVDIAVYVTHFGVFAPSHHALVTFEAEPIR